VRRLSSTLLLLFLLAAALHGADREGGERAAARPDGALLRRGGLELSYSTPGTRFLHSLRLHGWRTDFSRRSVRLAELYRGGPGRDVIPALNRPVPAPPSGGDRFLAQHEPVLAVSIGDETRAYPLQILVWHELVNDVIAGRPVLVTYCPLCNSALAFDRRLGGRTLTFGTTGLLRRSDLVMYDRQTESWWQQLGGEAIVGRLTGRRLRPLETEILSWREFRRSHPTGEVLSRHTGFDRDYGRTPYAGYDDPMSRPFLYSGRIDSRLPPMERVLALRAGGETLALPLSEVRKRGALNARVGGRPVVAVHLTGVASPLDRGRIAASRDVGSARTFMRRTAGRTLTLVRRGSLVTDRETGSVWTADGEAVAGPLRGRRLRRLRSEQLFWFALVAFKRNVRVAGRG
jgi:Protein of unknown function (DUF3179)